jgi:two-component system response regulator AtoC
VLTALGVRGQAVQVKKQGVDDYLVKGAITPDSLIQAVRKALNQKKPAKDPDHSHPSPMMEERLNALVGNSPAVKDLEDRINKVAPYRSPVLITGESGTGKELIARSIHEQSQHKDRPFITVHLGSLPISMLDSELFGHVKGAFPGADEAKIGCIEKADGGTVFFHDIADLPQSLQPKLLRVLQHRKFRRLGDSEEQAINVRIICATSRDLWAMIREGTFREDLLYGLNVVHLNIPPLHERPEDIPVLAEHILSEIADKKKIDHRSLSPDALRLLMEYHWPGNIRELTTVLERVTLSNDAHTITLDHLPKELRPAPKGITFYIPPDLISLKNVIREMTERAEKELINRALSQTNSNRTHAAKLLGISHRSLLYKLRDYKIR